MGSIAPAYDSVMERASTADRTESAGAAGMTAGLGDTAAERSRAEELRNRLLDNLPIGAALCEYDGAALTVKHVNNSYWTLVGREPCDCAGYSALDAIHPDDRRLVVQELRSAIRQKRNAEVNARLLSGGDLYKPFRVEAGITLEPDGRYSVFASYSPITERTMSIQEMLPVALSTMMSYSGDYSYVKDRDSRYICCSRAVLDMNGLKDEQDIMGKTDYDLFDRELADMMAENDRHVLKTGQSVVDFEVEVPIKSGGALYVCSSLYPIKDAAGSIIGLYGVSRDMRKERELMFELDTLLNTIPSGVLKYAADETKEFAYVSRKFIESLGYTEESFKDKFRNRFSEMVWREDRATVELEVLRQEGGGEIGRLDYRIEAADGTLRWFHDEGVRITDVSGRSWYYVTLLDITEQHKAEEALRMSEELNRLAIEHSGKTVARFDVEKHTLTLPESIRPIFEVSKLVENVPEEQIRLGKISPETAGTYRLMFNGITEGSASGSVVYQRSSTVGWRWLEAQYTTVFSDAGSPVSAVISFTDITEQLEKELVYNKWQQSLENRPTQSYTLFRCNLSKNASFESREGTLVDLPLSDSAKTFTELTEEYAARVALEDRERYLAFMDSDTMLASYYRGHRSDTLEFRELGPDGAVRWLRLSVDLVEYPNSKDVEAYLMYEDISESKTAEIRTRTLAETDPLTGILNRSAFIERMESIINSSAPGEKHAMLMLDVDHFKEINDSCGHDVGDRVLLELTGSMRAVLRRGDLIGRLGGDEFLIFLQNVTDGALAARKAQQLCSLGVPIPELDAVVTVSIGIAMLPQDGLHFDELYRKADAALYRQKRAGRDGYHFISHVGEDGEP